GFPNGTKAKVTLFREHEETKDKAIESLDAEIKDDKIEVAWKWDPSKTKDDKSAWGIRRFVAEVKVESAWAKTDVPLDVELPTIADGRWSAPQVGPGGTVQAIGSTLGFPDGTEAKLELWAHGFHDEGSKKKDLEPVKVEGGKVLVALSCGDGNPLEKPGE